MPDWKLPDNAQEENGTGKQLLYGKFKYCRKIGNQAGQSAEWQCRKQQCQSRTEEEQNERFCQRIHMIQQCCTFFQIRIGQSVKQINCHCPASNIGKQILAVCDKTKNSKCKNEAYCITE